MAQGGPGTWRTRPPSAPQQAPGHGTRVRAALRLGRASRESRAVAGDAMQPCLAIAAGLALAGASGGDGALDAAANEEAVVVEDGAFEEEYVEQLRRGILNITMREEKGIKRPYRFDRAFSSAYTFFFTSTLEGLPHASAVLGLPLEGFLDRGVDPRCNAFFLNGVVLSAGAAPAQPPWHDFAITVHADQSLRVYAADVALPDDGTARTVVILYLSDVLAGGELEVYDHFGAAEAAHREAERRALSRCRGGRGAKRARCESLVADRAILNTTRGRLAPRRGRLVRFRGSRSHAVRRLRTVVGASAEQARVSLVLEQFSFPPGVLRRIPTVWSERGGRPLFASGALRERFVSPSGGPRAWGGG
uniref:Uncharacterized protein n=1 Tax=Alexandrium monilatum TaxID=311494 RepID=A0A7S4SKK8_9DINO